MSLRDAANRAGLSASFVGLVERGSTEIAISRLIRLADAYGALVADLLADVHESRVEFVAAADALQAETNVEGVEIVYLATPSWGMEPFVVRLEPGAKLGGLSHGTEEFIHCIAGEATLSVAGQAYKMAPGDTILIPPLAEHCYANDAKVQATVIGAIIRPETGQNGPLPIWASVASQAQTRSHADVPSA